jgi:t-SNARE complex subunit (syntaxin)
MSDRQQWGQIEETNRLRERVTVLEQKLSYLEQIINALRQGQSENRAYSEQRFDELKKAQEDVKADIRDLKTAISNRVVLTTDETGTRRIIIGIGFTVAVLVVVLLMLWVRLGAAGIHF